MLNQFGWNTDDKSSQYKGGKSLHTRIGVTPEGKHEIRNCENPDESQVFDSPEELGEALAAILGDAATE